MALYLNQCIWCNCIRTRILTASFQSQHFSMSLKRCCKLHSPWDDLPLVLAAYMWNAHYRNNRWQWDHKASKRLNDARGVCPLLDNTKQHLLSAQSWCPQDHQQALWKPLYHLRDCIHSRTNCFPASRWLLTTLIDHKIVWNLIQLIQRANRNNVVWLPLTYCPLAFSASHSRGLFFWFMLALKLILSSSCHLLLHMCAWSSWTLLKNGLRFM